MLVQAQPQPPPLAMQSLRNISWHDVILERHAGQGSLSHGGYSVAAVRAAAEAQVESALALARAGAEGGGTSTGEGGGGSPSVASIREVLEETWRAQPSGERFLLSEQVRSCVHSCTRIGGEGDGAALELTAILDPLSKATQTLTPLLIELKRTLGVAITLVLAPKLALHELPLQRIYAMAVSLDPKRASAPTARLEVLHSPQTLTLVPRAPPPWMLTLQSTSDRALDLDNIQPQKLQVGKEVGVSYVLQHLLLSGACMEQQAPTKQPKKRRAEWEPQAWEPPVSHCKGAEVVMVSAGADVGVPRLARALRLAAGAPPPPVADTMVMGGNRRGYFQLKAGPGLWALETPTPQLELSAVPPPAKGKRKPALASAADAKDGGGGRGGRLSVPIVGYAGLQRNLYLSRAAGAEAGAGGKVTAGHKMHDADGDVVHIFSLASGLLYERFLRIMMKSTRERTSRRLKFWVLGNFLSPSFRETVASGRLAEAVGAGVEVELVQYSWPSWLRSQTEKQRLIWGYKILFLDVIFPQRIRKIIYIDADQIVQGDVGELWDHSLLGAAVGMTPFCLKQPNPDTKGFRFWESGFWAGALGERPYHISALFVIDLAVFRRQGYGDTYRETYNLLTADPNSLANLDQDLPNYLQHQVPIHSLPEQWLWCESWCSNDSLAAAKTIDLCNNPLTKEPKLDQVCRARATLRRTTMPAPRPLLATLPDRPCGRVRPQARRIGGSRWALLDGALEAALSGAANKDEL